MSLPDDDTHASLSLDSRVVKVETAIEGLREDVTGMKGDLRTIALSVTSGFDQLRREYSTSRQTNWGWVTGFVAICISIAGAVMTSLVLPLNVRDEALHERTNDIKVTADKAWEQAIRNDERTKSLERAINKGS